MMLRDKSRKRKVDLCGGEGNMKTDKLSELSMQLSVDVLALVRELKEHHEQIISNQIGRSATSVCANIAESKYAQSRADFIAKLSIALKEASETGRWLEMLYKSAYISELRYKQLDKTCATVRILLIASIKTAKNNHLIQEKTT
ncbi:MAG: four helix bundle protein [Clostridia bacterium]|nr:four helix bundle protein [Clostridia bacterium]